MKPVAFDYERPTSIGAAIAALAGVPGAKVLAGGQTLGPMLNLRLAQPTRLIDVTRIPELTRVVERPDAIVLGACITHAAVEDGRAPDPACGMLAFVAHRIAYRAVRTRGTIGGSLAHADPAADWLTCLAALEASVSISGGHGQRLLPLGRFVSSAMATELAGDELIDGIEVPRLSAGARWGYHKICRKTGEFAEAIGAVVIDRGRCRIVAGATGGLPIVLDRPAAEVLADPAGAVVKTAELYAASFPGDLYAANVHTACVRRALEQARSS
jgi:aerobic carbon-monoxide dehydrogenase medium subunit